MCDAFLNVVKKQNRILEYTAQNPKNTTEKLNVTDELLQLSWTALVNHINNSDDSVDLKDISANAFIFAGNYDDADGNNKNLYLLAQKNPILSFKKTNSYLCNEKQYHCKKNNRTSCSIWENVLMS